MLCIKPQTLLDSLGIKSFIQKQNIYHSYLIKLIIFQLIKVETGLMDGEVLYHEYIHKTEEEKAEILRRREETK